jgi:uncharacterized membrane protein YkoI
MANIWQEKQIAKIPLWFTQNEREQSIELIKLGFTVEIAVNEHRDLLNLEYYRETIMDTDIGDWKIGFDCDELDEDDFPDDDEDQDEDEDDGPNLEGYIQAHLKGAILSIHILVFSEDLEEAESEFSCLKYRYEQAIAVIKETIALQQQQAFKNQLCLAV